MFQGTCHRQRELALEPGTQHLHICLLGVRHSMKTPIMAMAPGRGLSHPLSTKKPGKHEIFIFTMKSLLTNICLTTLYFATKDNQ